MKKTATPVRYVGGSYAWFCRTHEAPGSYGVEGVFEGVNKVYGIRYRVYGCWLTTTELMRQEP